MTSDIAWSGADCTPGVTPRQLVQSSSENDIEWFGNCPEYDRLLNTVVYGVVDCDAYLRITMRSAINGSLLYAKGGRSIWADACTRTTHRSFARVTAL